MNVVLNESTITFEGLLNKCSKQLIEEDGKTLISYALATKNDGMLALSLLPYFALYCRSAQEFFGKRVIDNEIDKQINDIRNGLKIYSGRYSKGKDATLYSDKQQNQIFKDMLRFSFMKSWNIHYNLGVYFDMEDHIIGDTQILNYFLNASATNVNVQKKHAFNVGKILGEKIAFILKDMCGVDSLTMKDEISSCPRYGYRDFNTNRKSDFFNNSIDKEMNLIILHILSNIGFVQHILSSMLPKDNTWVFRIEYIVTHYAWSGLKKIKQHCDNDKIVNNKLTDDIKDLIDKGTALFPSDFRNCMMHYDLCNKGKTVIVEEKYNPEEPFYGLIGSCFEGKVYDEFASELRTYILELERCLLSWFHVDIRKAKWDL